MATKISERCTTVTFLSRASLNIFLVCAGDSDLTISSSDGVLFKLHRKHLEVHSDVFADAENATLPANGADEVVVLSETSSVLDVLFQYMYRQPQPNLQLVEFSVFAGVAEAAEKYMVYSALPAVLIRMRRYLGSYPLQVLDYAARHNYKDLANKAVRSTVGLTLAEAGKNLSPDTFLKWVRIFYQNYFFFGLHITEKLPGNFL
ncbi:hypothetical protein B0H16DRAFT_1322069 [Mycena metata]|uniref:BTB domain-containing protein n=1 Tax=Mycena metata TaxID=1033252 RepID=A0AAD7IKZ6_9AGAR|nr:hypothetical protein B0H16DRAFT_1322069 [Mycena metata]